MSGTPLVAETIDNRVLALERRKQKKKMTELLHSSVVTCVTKSVPRPIASDVAQG